MSAPYSSNDIQSHLDSFQTYIAGLLKESLPEICSGSDDWWTILVRSARLRGSQSRKIKTGVITDMGTLDLVSLCSVLKHNWKKLTEYLQVEDPQMEGELQCDNLIGLRNRLSHRGSDNHMSDEDTLSALLSLKKLCALLNAPSDLTDAVEGDISRVLSTMRGDDASDQSETEHSGQESVHDNVSSDETSLTVKDESGIPLKILGMDAQMQDQICKTLDKSTFIGIDFGTSTTIASRVVYDSEQKILTTEPIVIPQIDRLGRSIEDFLVPSCVSLNGDDLLVGQGAAELKSSLTPGVDTWFSFKMELGVDLGPKYYRSKLDGQRGNVEIRKPQDVAAYFFKYLRTSIENWVETNDYPRDIRYSVSVPASFEANQRLDLCQVMESAGMKIEDNSIIDEPNAAFISYILDSLKVGDGVLDVFRDRLINVLVFDFGAGTCDISVLEVGAVGEKLVSKNLAISQFRALGGDNIDRKIARDLLWPAMEKACVREDQNIRLSELEQVVLPRLLPVAEQIKMQCSKLIAAQSQGGDVSVYQSSSEKISVDKVGPISIRDITLELDNPAITLSDFFDVMKPFLEQGASRNDDQDVISIFDPIANALVKANIEKDELDMVLFIGGSAQNPLVQDAIKRYFGRFVECVIGQDVRTPVSRGAALHSLAWNGLGMQFIRPITSETLSFLTAGGIMHPFLPAGSVIPSPEILFSDDLIVPNEGQKKVELPICVSDASKILHILELRSPDTDGFHAGDRITTSVHLDENKLLHVSAKLAGAVANESLVNPLANESLTEAETRRLLARQKLNKSIVECGGKPDARVLMEFADACSESGAFLEAAESYEALERIDTDYATSANSTKICYLYGRAGKRKLGDRWAEEAYSRQPSWVSAFNLSLRKRASGAIEEAILLLKEALTHSPDNPVVMDRLGAWLVESGEEAEGREILKKALGVFRNELRLKSLDSDDISRARNVARFFTDEEMLKELDDYAAELSSESAGYSEENLAASLTAEKTINE